MSLLCLKTIQHLHCSQSNSQNFTVTLKAYHILISQILRSQFPNAVLWLTLVKFSWSPSHFSYPQAQSCLRAFALSVPMAWNAIPPNLSMVFLPLGLCSNLMFSLTTCTKCYPPRLINFSPQILSASDIAYVYCLFVCYHLSFLEFNVKILRIFLCSLLYLHFLDVAYVVDAQSIFVERIHKTNISQLCK